MFYKSEKHVFYAFYLQINVFNICYEYSVSFRPTFLVTVKTAASRQLQVVCH